MKQYVFSKDMKFIGDFEGLYKHDKNPWYQTSMDGDYGSYNFWARNNLLKRLCWMEGDVTEVGCGLGYFLKYLKDSNFNRELTGVDISPTAIKKAKKLLPGINFEVADITKKIVENDIIILNEVLWYILHDFDKALNNCKCKYLIISQAFITDQKYGNNIVDGWSGLIKYLVNKHYTILSASYDMSGKKFMNGQILATK